MALNAPAMASYNLLNAGMADINAQAKLQGFAIVKLHFKTDKKDPPTMHKVFLRCDRGIAYISAARKHYISSKQIDCPFKAMLAYLDIGWFYKT